MGAIWVRLPLQVIGNISHGAAILLALLLNIDDGSHTVTVRRNVIGQRMHLGERQISALISELEFAGYVTQKERLRDCMRLTLKDDILPPKKHYGGDADSPSDSSIPQNVQQTQHAQNTQSTQNRRPYRPQQNRPKKIPGVYASEDMLSYVTARFPEIMDLDDG